MPVRRFDKGELRKAERTSHGFLRVDAYITRAGVFTYLNEDGTERREFRPPEEVFSPASLSTFRQIPVTDGHPTEMVTAANARKYSCGTSGDEVAPDGEYVRAPLSVFDGELITKAEAQGQREVSCGYTCDIDPTPGEWRGIRYDCRQTNIRGNHIALVSRGRAGPDVRIRLDAGDAIQGEPVPEPPNPEKTTMVKRSINGIDLELSETAAQALDAERGARKDAEATNAAAVAAAKGEAEKLKARADALEDELKKVRADLEAAPAKVRTELRARLERERLAGDVLGAEVKLDALTDAELDVAMLKKLAPDVDASGKSAEYVRGRLDFALETRSKSTVPAVARARADALPAGGGARGDTRESMVLDARKAHAAPLAYSKDARS
jgi:hypothetical protein